MAKTGGPVAKLRLKQQQHETKFRKGNAQSIIARIKEADGGRASRFVAMEEHRRVVRGVIGKSGEYIKEPRRIMPAETFRGDGLPNEGYDIGDDGKFVGLKAPKTNAERAAADKRNSLKSEWKEDFRPQPWAGRRWS